MKMFITAIVSLAAAGALVACTQPTSDVGSGGAAAISDSAQITQRPDGQFDVVCKDGRHETDTASEIQMNAICLEAPNSGTIVAGTSRSTTATGGQSLFTFGPIVADGQTMWKGFASFTTTPNCVGSFTITDGLGNTYPGRCGQGLAYARLPVPVTITAGSPFLDTGFETSGGTMSVSAVSYEILAFNPEVYALTGRADSLGATLATLGPDLLGAKLTVTPNVQFFKNFTNADACTEIDFVGSDGAKAAVTAANGNAKTTTLSAPIAVTVASPCVGARVAAPENKDTDFVVGVSDIEVAH